MSGTVRWGLALGVVLALASAGCVVSPGASAGSDDDVAEARHGLDSIDGPSSGDDGDTDASGDDGQDDGDTLGGDVQPGDDSEDPQPQPWRILRGGDPDSPSDPSPMTHGGSSTPSSGNSGK